MSKISYVMVGYPSYEESMTRAKFLLKNGITRLEIGIPFSDPLADGPIIQNAANLALNNNITIKDCIRFIKELNHDKSKDLIVMSYINPIYSYGVKQFTNAVDEYITAIIIPDVPTEEYDLIKPITDSSISVIPLVSLTSPLERIKRIAETSSDFVYLVSINGITGTKEPDLKSLREKIEAIKKVTNKKIAIGFGIKTKKQVHEVLEFADYVISASQVIKLFDEGKEDEIVELFS